jgi:hypothetical protein
LAAVQSLEEQPERCGLAPEAEDLGLALRQLLFGKRQGLWRILFTVEGNTVNVLHLRHAAREPLRPGDLRGGVARGRRSDKGRILSCSS